MFNFGEYVCTKKFLILGIKESRKNKKKDMIVKFHFPLTSLKQLNYPWLVQVLKDFAFFYKYNASLHVTHNSVF